MGTIGYLQRREGGGQGDGEEETFTVHPFVCIRFLYHVNVIA